MSSPSMFAAARRVLRQEAISDDPEEWGGDRREAWDQLDRLESTLIMMRSGMDDLRPDAEMKDEREFWARHGQRTTIELIERAVSG